MAETPAFETIEALVQGVDIIDIRVHEERARRVSWDVPEDAKFVAPAPDMKAGVNLTGDRMSFRFRMTLADQYAEYVADFEAIYAILPEPTPAVPKELQLEFMERVAFMLTYPYIRASIFNSASRLGTERPVLSIVRAGQFELGDEMTESDVRETFFDTVPEQAKPAI